MTNDIEAKDKEITKLRIILPSIKNNKGENIINQTSSDLSYESEELSVLDPKAFTPVFEKDIADQEQTKIPESVEQGASITEEGARASKRNNTSEGNTNALQRPRIDLTRTI